MQLDVISHVLGDWGPWQLRTVLIIFLCKIPAAWFMACLIFTAPEPRYGEFHCKEPEGVSAGNLTEYIQIAHPLKVDSSGEFTSQSDVCYVYQNANERWQNLTGDEDEFIFEYPENTFEYSEQVLVPCESFIHTGDIRSIITDFDLVCSRTILVALTQTFHLLGVLIGGIIANQMLYRYILLATL